MQGAQTQFQPCSAGGLTWDVLPVFGLPWQGAGSVDLSQQVALTISYPLLTVPQRSPVAPARALWAHKPGICLWTKDSLTHRAVSSYHTAFAAPKWDLG